MTKPELTPERLDAILTPRRDRIIWTAAAIGRRIGRGEDFVRHVLAKLPRSPVKKIGGRLCVDEGELFAFLKNPEDTR